MEMAVVYFFVGSWILAAFNIEWAVYAWGIATAVLVAGLILTFLIGLVEEAINLGGG
jgi:hypothetical protein